MKNKKSYMNTKNILSETVLEKLFKWIVHNPALKKNKEIQSKLEDINNDLQELEKSLNLELKTHYPDSKPIKIKPFKIK
jgi:hypothetical protein